MTHHAIRVDMECNADEFWSDLREAMPHVARSLERNDCAVVSQAVLERLDSIGAFTGDPSPLIDYGSAGDGWSDVCASRHEVIEE